MGRFRSMQEMRFSGFTSAEVKKMERYFVESTLLNKQFYKRIARSFSVSAARAGKPVVNWTEVERWYQRKIESLKNGNPTDISLNPNLSDNFLDVNPSIPETDMSNNDEDSTRIGNEIGEFPNLEFEARSSKDGGWYDVDKLLSHRYLPSGDAFLLDLLDLGLRKTNGLMRKVQ